MAHLSALYVHHQQSTYTSISCLVSPPPPHPSKTLKSSAPRVVHKVTSLRYVEHTYFGVCDGGQKELDSPAVCDRKSDSERVENEIGDSIRQATFAYYYFVSSLEPHTIYLKQMSSKLSRGGAEHDSSGIKTLVQNA